MSKINSPKSAKNNINNGSNITIKVCPIEY